MNSSEVYVLSAVRTPIGKFGGAFAGLSAPELGGPVASEALRRARVAPADVDEVVFGHARQAGNGPNPARQVGRRAGVPDAVPAFTVNQACASGLKAILLGADAIRLGRSRRVLAGGQEAMSRTPYYLPRARFGQRMGHSEILDGMTLDGFLCPLCGQVMGETAETLARERGIPRGEQDAFAFRSQRRAAEAARTGRFDDEILPIEVPAGRENRRVAADEHPRPETTLEGLASLSPVFSREGTITAGNSSGITDGAAAVVLGEASAADQTRSSGGRPLARLVDSAIVGVDPARMGIGPVPAVRELCRRAGLSASDFGLVELNEAFAAQAIACIRELRLDEERVNVSGGAIALGHPIGATGARIVVTLLHEMARRDVSLGLATLCVSGGMGVAAAFELLPK